MSQQQLSIEEALKSASAAFQSGQIPQAINLCKGILGADPGNAPATHLLGLISFRVSAPDKALMYLMKACDLEPNNPEYRFTLGSFFKATGQLDQAEACYRKCLELDRDAPAALGSLGHLLIEKNRDAEGLALMEKLIAGSPDFADGYFGAALVHYKANDLDKARELLEKTLELQPDFADALIVLGNIHSNANRTEQAIDAYERARRLKTDLNRSKAIYNNLGVAYTNLGKYKEACSILTQGVALDNGFIEARNNLGVALRLMGKPQEAIESLESAIKMHPEYVEAYCNLGRTYADLNRHERAIECYSKAAALDPRYFGAFVFMGASYVSMGLREEAEKAYKQALAVRPGDFSASWGLCFASLPAFFESFEQREQILSTYRERLAELGNQLDFNNTEQVHEAMESIGTLPPFYLICHPGNHREAQKQYGELVSRIMSARYPQYAVAPNTPPPAGGEKIRVGIVSRYFCRHEYWDLLIHGWLEQLDITQFSVVGYSTGGVADDATDEAKRLCDRLVQGLGLEQLCKVIETDRPHALLFVDLATDPVALKLAALRLADTQICFWAWPLTSGLPTIDYFASGELLEPADGQEHYTEKLLALDGLGNYYLAPAADPDFEERLSVPDDAIVFLCLQSLYSYLPAYDSIFARIAKDVPKAHFVFRTPQEEMGKKFKARLNKAFQQEGVQSAERVIVVPATADSQLHALCARGHIFLDSCGLNELAKSVVAIVHNVPVVTMQSAEMRGRQGAALLTKMGVTETIAHDADDYVRLACELGNSEERRQAVKSAIQSKKHLVFEDSEAMVTLERLLKQRANQASA